MWRNRRSASYVGWWGLIVCVVGGCASQRHDAAARAARDELRGWGLEILDDSERSFRRVPPDDVRLYVQDVKRSADGVLALGEGKGWNVSMWSAGVQAAALVSGARYDDRYRQRLVSFLDGLDRYWQVGNGLGGYDVLPGPKKLDRYYDDNAWMVLVLIEAYELTREAKYLARARETMAFVLSGEDRERGGGGIYWHEQNRNTKHACSAGPAALGALRLHRLTGDAAYETAGKRLYSWLRDTLVSKDGLVSDKLNTDGSIDETKWSYNTALLIRVELELGLRGQAVKRAQAAERYWIRPADSAIQDEGHFAYQLVEAFAELSEATGDTHWTDLCSRALRVVRANYRSKEHLYGKHWNRPPEPNEPIRLIDQASVARAMLRLFTTP